MRHSRYNWILLAIFAQFSHLQAQGPDAPAPITAPNAGATDAKSAPAGPLVPPGPSPPIQTELDKYVAEMANRIDQIDYISAEFVQVIHIGEQEIRAKGVYRKGPRFHSRFELDVNIDGSLGHRVNVCDGKTGYRYEKVHDAEILESFHMDQILPILEKSNMPAPHLRQVFAQLPVLRPGDMLRGYLESMTFTKSEQQSLGADQKWSVKSVDGEWKPNALANLGVDGQVSGDGSAAPIPKDVRLYIDEKSGWPVKVELFTRDKSNQRKTVFVFEFRKVSFGDPLPDQEFAFVPPKNLEAQDVTPFIINRLQVYNSDDSLTATPEAAALAAPAAVNNDAPPAAANPAVEAKTPAPAK